MEGYFKLILYFQYKRGIVNTEHVIKPITPLDKLHLIEKHLLCTKISSVVVQLYNSLQIHCRLISLKENQSIYWTLYNLDNLYLDEVFLL